MTGRTEVTTDLMAQATFLAAMLVDIDTRARLQGTSLEGLLNWVAQSAYGVSILPDTTMSLADEMAALTNPSGSDNVNSTAAVMNAYATLGGGVG